MFTSLEWMHFVNQKQNGSYDNDNVTEFWRDILRCFDSVTRIGTKKNDREPTEAIISLVQTMNTAFGSSNPQFFPPKISDLTQQEPSELLFFLSQKEEFCEPVRIESSGLVTCIHCQTESESETQPSFMVELPLGAQEETNLVPVNDLLRVHYSDEDIEFLCKQCNGKSALKRECLKQSGSFLIIRIKREMKIIVPKRSKRGTKGAQQDVKFTKNCSPVDIFHDNGRIDFCGKKYMLVGVLYHRGTELSSGHFVVESKRPTIVANNENERCYEWHLFNDETCNKIDCLFKMMPKEQNLRRKSCAMLMYKAL